MNPLNPSTKSLVLFVVIFHAALFVAEAFLWMQPAVYTPALAKIATGSALPAADQAQILRPVFFNQGFYNLFLALAGVAGLRLCNRGNPTAGRTLLLYMCLFATGAGIVLAVSTRAYIGAAFQSVPAALAAALLSRRPEVDHNR